MNTLLSIRTNILYSKKKKENNEDADEFIKHNELIFLVDKPKYIQNNEGNIVRSRGVEELRFTVSEKAFEALIKLLTELKNTDESGLS